MPPFDPWAIPPLIAATCTMVTMLAALFRGGAPPGRLVFVLLAAGVIVELLWLAGFYAGLDPETMDLLSRAASFFAVALIPLLVAFSCRFGQHLSPYARQRLVPIGLSVAAFLGLWFWGAGRNAIELMEIPQGRDILLGLEPGPSRATAVGLLLAGCFGAVRLRSVVEAARVAGVGGLARSGLAPMLGYFLLVLAMSQILLYGAFSLRILAFGSLALVPVMAGLFPVFAFRSDPSPVLPASAKLQSSSLLLLALGLFMVGLAALGEVLHQFFPQQGLFWFRWGSTSLGLLFAGLAVVPGVRRLLTRAFDRGLYASRWDFRREWRKINNLLETVDTPSQLVTQLHHYLADAFGPTGVALWLRRGDASGTLQPVLLDGMTLPLLGPGNPIHRSLREAAGMIEFQSRPRRLEDLPPLVENLDLIDAKGFRVFIQLRTRGQDLGVLALAPAPGFQLDADHRALLENVVGQLVPHVALWCPGVRSSGAGQWETGDAVRDHGHTR